jgi:hypothetical protein
MAVQVRMTAEQLAELTDDRYKKSELVKGELIVMSPTGFEHGIVSARIAQILNDFVRGSRAGVYLRGRDGFYLAAQPGHRAGSRCSIRPQGEGQCAADLVCRVCSRSGRGDRLSGRSKQRNGAKNLGVSCSRPRASSGSSTP